MQRSEALAALELGDGATPAEIKAAYRDLVKVWHPDRFGSDARLRLRAEERLRRINEAYRRLESGDFDREQVDVPDSVVHDPPQVQTQLERDAALRGWMYLAIVVLVGAFVGYAVVEHARAARETASAASPTVQPEPAVKAGAVGTAETTKTKTTRPSQPVPMRVTHLSAAQMGRLEEACGGFAPESQEHSDCVQAQVAQMTGAASSPRSGLDLSGLTVGERTSMEHVCARSASYSQCAAAQIASLAAEPERPDLTRLNAKDRSAVERACSSARDHDGPAAYDRCAAEFEKALVVGR